MYCELWHCPDVDLTKYNLHEGIGWFWCRVPTQVILNRSAGFSVDCSPSKSRLCGQHCSFQSVCWISLAASSVLQLFITRCLIVPGCIPDLVIVTFHNDELWIYMNLVVYFVIARTLAVDFTGAWFCFRGQVQAVQQSSFYQQPHQTLPPAGNYYQQTQQPATNLQVRDRVWTWKDVIISFVYNSGLFIWQLQIKLHKV